MNAHDSNMECLFGIGAEHVYVCVCVHVASIFLHFYIHADMYYYNIAHIINLYVSYDYDDYYCYGNIDVCLTSFTTIQIWFVFLCLCVYVSFRTKSS